MKNVEPMIISLHPSCNQWVIYVAPKDFICEVHLAFMQEINQNNCSFEQVTILGFCWKKMFHEASPFEKPPIPYSTCTLYPTCILLYACIASRACIGKNPHLPNCCIINITSCINLGSPINVQNMSLCTKKSE